MVATIDEPLRRCLSEAERVRSIERMRTQGGERWLRERVLAAMRGHDLSLAGLLAGILAGALRGSEWYPQRGSPRRDTLEGASLSRPKLRHDIAQLRYLRIRGLLDGAFDALIEGYEETLQSLAVHGDNERAPMSPEDRARIGHAYGRLLHVAPAPRLDRALSPGWDRAAAESAYAGSRPGVVVIDDFLTPEALASLNRFCLESTVWSGNRYADGRLGAFLFSGFSCPLLLQIAEEIRDAFPTVIGRRHALAQLWGFKNTGYLPPDSTIHADFAAVNVNFWITPDAANADPSTGGMVVYDIDAPSNWDFATYNERIDIIRDYLACRRPGVIRVPYRQNRAVIFNSDLFHATEAVRFHPGYVNHRINVTMLYGDRANDVHQAPRPDREATSPSRRAPWRSPVFSRACR